MDNQYYSKFLKYNKKYNNLKNNKFNEVVNKIKDILKLGDKLLAKDFITNDELKKYMDLRNEAQRSLGSYIQFLTKSQPESESENQSEQEQSEDSTSSEKQEQPIDPLTLSIEKYRNFINSLNKKELEAIRKIVNKEYKEKREMFFSLDNKNSLSQSRSDMLDIIEQLNDKLDIVDQALRNIESKDAQPSLKLIKPRFEVEEPTQPKSRLEANLGSLEEDEEQKQPVDLMEVMRSRLGQNRLRIQEQETKQPQGDPLNLSLIKYKNYIANLNEDQLNEQKTNIENAIKEEKGKIPMDTEKLLKLNNMLLEVEGSITFYEKKYKIIKIFNN